MEAGSGQLSRTGGTMPEQMPTTAAPTADIRVEEHQAKETVAQNQHRLEQLHAERDDLDRSIDSVELTLRALRVRRESVQAAILPFEQAESPAPRHG